jgi:dipeptidyl aminopeptidase/acylaminoacyl peptidase
MKTLLSFTFSLLSVAALSQNVMTPETMWSLGRVSGLGISIDGTNTIYQVSTPSIVENRSFVKFYSVPIKGGTVTEVKNGSDLIRNRDVSPDGKYFLTVKDVKLKKVFAQDFYPDLDKANAQIYETLNYRHWDEWEDGKFSHLIVTSAAGGEGKDLMENDPYDCPQKPFGDEEDYTWSPDSKFVLYVAKKKYGVEYAVSTNTDIYSYEVATGKTTNLTQGMMGYDTKPQFSKDGVLAWLSMKRDGFESDKNDIVVKAPAAKTHFYLTGNWDGTVNDFTWSADGSTVYFTAPIDGTVQLFQVNYPGMTEVEPKVKQITKGDFDISDIVGQAGNTVVVARTDMNHAAELYTVNLTNGQMTQLTHVNDATFGKLSLSKIEKRFVNTTDNKKMLVWVIYPPEFDPKKKYPTLLYCQGGPQSALSQFYSYRWNFQLMTANGYIIVSPNRRGMPGHGVAWNEQISKDHGGQVMKDYLSAIDDVSKESYVDANKLGCVGPSYGGYSAFYLAGIHNKRFKTFIAHDGIFNLKSMYGTTEELFFVDWDYGGPYWDKSNAAAQKSYNEFDPSALVDKWDTPIFIIQGGKDYRVPPGQGLEAFQAAQLRGIKSKLLYLPEENHWVLHSQNAIVWQREFFKWLKETLN